MNAIITEPLFYAVAIPSVILLGLSKGGFAGLGIASTPMLALYLPPLEAAALILPILITQDLISTYVFRHDWDAKNLKVMLPGAVWITVSGRTRPAWIDCAAMKGFIVEPGSAVSDNARLRRADTSAAPRCPGTKLG